MDWTEIDGPDGAVPDFFQSNIPAAEEVAHANPAALPAHAPHLADPADLEVVGILRLDRPLRKGAVGGLIERSGRLETERLVGPLVIEDIPELVEPALLSPQVFPRRLRCPSFERSVHPLMPAVLLRLSGLDLLRPDPQLNPPDGELREAAEGVGGEGLTVVGADPNNSNSTVSPPLSAQKSKVSCVNSKGRKMRKSPR